MKIEKRCDGNVIIVEDFLSLEEVKMLDSFMRNFDYDNLKEHDFKYWGKRLINDHQMKLNPGYENVMNDIMPTLNIFLERTKVFLNKEDYEADWLPSPHNLIKMFNQSSGVRFQDDDSLEMFIHIDNQPHMESPIMWGAVIYFNDDYEGGEIYYPDYEYLYKPKAGSMALHRGSTRHGVKKVTSGERFCAASLVTINGNWNENPQPARTDDPKTPYFYPSGYWGKRAPLDPIQGDIKVPRSDGSVAKYNKYPEII